MLSYSGKKSGLSADARIVILGPADEDEATKAVRKSRDDRVVAVALSTAQEVLAGVPDDHNVRVSAVWNENGFHLSIQ